MGVGVHISDILALDDARQSMRLDAYSVLRWHDPRLADSLRGDVSVSCALSPDQLWFPPIQALSLRSQQQLYDDITLVDNVGVVTLIRRQILEVAVPLDYREFPFDEQELGISFSPIIFDDEQIRFEALPGVTGAEEAYSLSGWEVDPPEIAVTASPYPDRPGQESRFSVSMLAHRDSRYWLIKSVVPLLMIVLMSGCVFVLPPESSQSQIGVGLTTMLTLIAYQFSLASELPRVSYLTRMDFFTLGSLMLVFCALLKATSVAVLLPRVEKSTIKSLDRFGRVGFVFALFAVVWSSLLR